MFGLHHPIWFIVFLHYWVLTHMTDQNCCMFMMLHHLCWDFQPAHQKNKLVHLNLFVRLQQVNSLLHRCSSFWKILNKNAKSLYISTYFLFGSQYSFKKGRNSNGCRHGRRAWSSPGNLRALVPWASGTSFTTPARSLGRTAWPYIGRSRRRAWRRWSGV